MIEIKVTYYPPTMFQDAEGPTSISKQIPIPALAKDPMFLEAAATAKELVAILCENSLTFSNEMDAFK